MHQRGKPSLDHNVSINKYVKNYIFFYHIILPIDKKIKIN